MQRAPSPTVPETSSMGSIADRMKALSGKGMNVGQPNKRISKDFGQPPSPLLPPSSKSASIGGMSVTGGAGNFGPARHAMGGVDVPRALPGKPPSPPESVDDRATVKPSATGSSTKSSNSGPSHQHPEESDMGARRSNNRPTTIREAPQESSSRSRSGSNAVAGSSQYQSSIVQGSSVRDGGALRPTASREENQNTASSRSRSGSNAVDGPTNRGPSIPELPASQPLRATAPPSPSHISSTAPPLRPITPVPVPAEPLRPVPPRSPSHPPPPEMADDMDKFANAFPSLSEFGKQFEEDEASFKAQNGTSYPFERALPSGMSNGHAPSGSRSQDHNNGPSFPQLPSFPVLPSVPVGLPSNPRSGLPPPPKAMSPPSPGGFEIPRPTSAPAPMDKDVLTTSPISEVPPPSIKSPSDRSFQSPTLSFPVAVPTPANGHSKPHTLNSTKSPITNGSPPQWEKPKFPIVNAVDPDTLRSYFLNPTVEMLLLDIRSEEEFQRGYVGKEYEPRGAKVNVIWMDPTVLMRQE